jgi:hypothetical protein
MDVNEHERRSTCKLRLFSVFIAVLYFSQSRVFHNKHNKYTYSKMRHNDGSICKITSPISMSDTMMAVFVRLLHPYFVGK